MAQAGHEWEAGVARDLEVGYEREQSNGKKILEQGAAGIHLGLTHRKLKGRGHGEAGPPVRQCGLEQVILSRPPFASLNTETNTSLTFHCSWHPDDAKELMRQCRE